MTRQQDPLRAASGHYPHTLAQRFMAKPHGRIGLMLLIILFALAAFTPLLANEHPLLQYTDHNGLTFPFLSSWHWSEWVLLGCAVFIPMTWLGLRTRLFRILLSIALCAALFALIIASTAPLHHASQLHQTAKTPGATAWSVHSPIAHNPVAINPHARRHPPGSVTIDNSDRASLTTFHLMGTDDHGSDVAARLLYATRTALAVGIGSAGIALGIALMFGLLMGFFAGWIDMIGMRVIEVFMALPKLILLLTVLVMIPPSWSNHMVLVLAVAIGGTSWMTGARLLRAEVLRLRHAPMIEAAQAIGLPTRFILIRHVLPLAVSPVLVDVSFGAAVAILLEANLSFLGIGIAPPQPSWGRLLAQAVHPDTGVFNWWLAVFPGSFIAAAVIAFNLLGDALRDALQNE